MDLLTMFRQSTIPFSIRGLLIYVCAIFSISRSRRNKTTPRKPPPEAGGAWPVIGVLHLLGSPEPPHITLGNMADKYGPILEALEVMGYNFSVIIFSLFGAYWRHVRKIATQELLSNHRLETLRHACERVRGEVTHERYLRSLVRVEQEYNEWWWESVLLRLIEWKDTTQKALRDLFDLGGSLVISDALPYLRWLDLAVWLAGEGHEEDSQNFVQFWLVIPYTQQGRWFRASQA